jgi:deoxyhypusine synthase
MAAVPTIASSAVLQASSEMPADSVVVRGYDFNHGVDYPALMAAFMASGYQATNFGMAIEEINRMVREKAY